MAVDDQGTEGCVVDEGRRARASSVKPMIEASDVPLSSWTRKPTVGGRRERAACGRMTDRSWRRG